MTDPCEKVRRDKESSARHEHVPLRREASLILGITLVGTTVLGTHGCRRADEAPPSGREMYLRYCASCHGVDGKGNGPVAPSLQQPPSDLTRLAERGRLDERYLMTVIDGRRLVRAHGPREMPVWGAVFQDELKARPYPGYTGLLRTRTLADYLQTIQEE
jgi:mono/diheme cytochrome c family protein